jgi:hypothetical protein
LQNTKQNIPAQREKMKNPFKLPQHQKKTLLQIIAVAATTILITTIIAIWLSKVTKLNIPSLGTITKQNTKATLICKKHQKFYINHNQFEQ